MVTGVIPLLARLLLPSARKGALAKSPMLGRCALCLCNLSTGVTFAFGVVVFAQINNLFGVIAIPIPEQHSFYFFNLIILILDQSFRGIPLPISGEA